MDLNENTKGDNAAGRRLFSFGVYSSGSESDAEEIGLPKESPNNNEDDNPLASEQHNNKQSHSSDTTAGKVVNIQEESSIPGEAPVGRTHLSRNTSLKGSERQSGSTTKSSQQKAFQSQPAAKHVIKDLGNKARARLEEEKSKRSEIKRLDAAPTEVTHKKRSVSTAFRTKPASLVRPKRNLPRAPQPRRSAHQRRKVEEWTPDTSQIPALPKELCSTIVKLHGLPVGCTLEQIKTFFTGLQPEHIFMVLRNKAFIPELDASNRSAPEDRYDRKYLRVFAKYASGPAAALATERSGETILVANATDDDDDEEDGTSVRKSYSIGVTQVTKEAALVLSALVRTLLHV
jgi:hypothetical protein